MNIDLDQLLKELEEESDAFINDILIEYDQELDRFLEELTISGNEFMNVFLRDMESTDINISPRNEELFDELVKRIPVDWED